MRTFIAINLPKEIKDYLFDLQKELKNKLPAKINWVAKKNLHITLKFLGETTEQNKKEICEILKNIKLKEFEVELDQIGTFPSENLIKVIWIGLKPEKQLIGLQHQIDAETIKFSNREQKFQTHLTLGRVKLVKNKEKFTKTIKEIETKKLKFKITKFEFMESILTKDGPKYKTIEEYK